MLSEEEWGALLARLHEEFMSRPMPTMEQITAAMREQRRIERDQPQECGASQGKRHADPRQHNGEQG